MKKFTLPFLLCLVLQAWSTAWAHECETPPCYEIEPELNGSQNAGKFSYNFQVYDELAKKIIKDTDLEVFHEKLLHFLVFDPALKEYQHVHPEFDGEKWTVELNLPVNGNYWIYLQGMSAANKKEFTINTRLNVNNGQTAHPVLPLLELRMGNDGISAVSLSGGVLRANREAMVMVNISRTNGTTPQITPYLGAKAHVVVVGNQGKSFLHAHPMDTENPLQMMAHVNFPKEGEYRVWVQFIDDKELKTIPLAVKVVR